MARVHLVLVVTWLLCIASEARADGNAEAAAASKKAIESDPIKDPPKSDFKPVAVTVNPLAMLVTRFGANIEYLPVRHHALVLNPYVAMGTATDDINGRKIETKHTGFGGEAGYRYYLGDDGADGLFIGSSLVFQRSQLHSKIEGMSPLDANLFVFGAVVDVGGQLVTKSGFTFGAGAGVGYLFGAAQDVATSKSVVVSGFVPRVLLTAGWSF